MTLRSDSINSDQLHEMLATAERAARAGGETLIAWSGKFSVREKGSADLVTDADIASQRAIERLIRESYPGHDFLGEEQSYALAIDLSAFCWVVDPLDVTTNYAHGYPCFAVSVALVVDGQPRVGVVYDPVADNCYAAALGQGAWLNGQSMSVSSTATLAQSLVAVSLPPQVKPESPDLVAFCRVAERCQAIRRTGSCALNLAHVATGSLDAFWAHHIHAWDVAAGVLLVSEAGGVVTDVNGGPFDVWRAHFAVASQSALHFELLPLVMRGAK